MGRLADRYPAVSCPAGTGNGKRLAAPFPAAAFLVGRIDSAAKNPQDHGVFPGGSPPPSCARVEGVEMKVVCSFSLLLRLAFWLTAVALVAGVALGQPGDTAPPTPDTTPVVVAHGEEVR
jgi:hypothetical protein